MPLERIERRKVWSGWLRLAHWSLAFATLALMLTGWLISADLAARQAMIDYHYIAGGVLALGLLLRLWLLVTERGPGGWRALVPGKPDLQAAWQTLQYYLSFTRAPLPRWYAHNPAWLPLYAILLLSLAALAVSGYLMDDRPMLFGLYVPRIHDTGAAIVDFIVVLHIAAVFLHDLKSPSCEVSGMINGYRYFPVQPLQTPPGEHHVSLDSFRR